jgi:hypothetical protein
MKAKYFFDRLSKYDESEPTADKKYCHAYQPKCVTIHREGNDTTWYSIFKDGRVFRYTRGKVAHTVMTLADLGDYNDYEIFSINQIIKSGYIELDKDHGYDVKNIMTKIYEYIENHNADAIMRDENATVIDKGVLKRYIYRTDSHVYAEITSVKYLCKENVARKHFGVPCKQFLRSMEDSSSIRVDFVVNMRYGNYDVAKSACESSLDDLMQYLRDMKIDCRWAQCRLKNPIYFYV